MLFQLSDGMDALNNCLRPNLARYDAEIAIINPAFRENCFGNIPHSMASIEKAIDSSVIGALYDKFDGVTFYLQKVMNILYMKTGKGERCTMEHLPPAIDYIVDFTSNTYEDLLYQ